MHDLRNRRFNLPARTAERIADAGDDRFRVVVGRRGNFAFFKASVGCQDHEIGKCAADIGANANAGRVGVIHQPPPS